MLKTLPSQHYGQCPPYIYFQFIYVHLLISGALATEIPAGHTAESQSTEFTQFRRIEQPVGNKVAVTLGRLSLTCGMNMFRGVLEVQASNASSKKKFSAQIPA